MAYALTIVSVAPLRRKAKHKSEMVSQLLLGEAVRILKTKDAQWIKVESLHDGYEGWVTWHMIKPVTKELAREPIREITSSLINKIEVDGMQIQVPLGAVLAARDLPGLPFTYRFEGQFSKLETVQPHADLIPSLTLPWLDVPYLWGGRTAFGIDCSGFAQIIFRQLGIFLPRDAWQQAQQGEAVKKLAHARAGDLAFFDDKDEIVHVGILLGPDKIVHAAGTVRVDPIDKDGIRRSDNGKRTHRLRAIKRMF